MERDGITVIPVAKARWGFGGGADQRKDEGAGGKQEDGAGGGGLPSNGPVDPFDPQGRGSAELSSRCFRFGNGLFGAKSIRHMFISEFVWRYHQNTTIHELQHAGILQLFESLPGLLPRRTN